MSVLSSDKASVLAAQQQFVLPAAFCLVAVVTIHCLPKFVPEQVRLLYVLAYFAACLCFLFQLVVPLKSFLAQLVAWRFEGAPEPLHRAARSLLYSLSQLVAIPSLLLMAFVASIACNVLAVWFPNLGTFAPLYNFVWYLSLIGFLLFPFAGGFLFTEVAQKYRLLSHELELTETFAPRALAELYRTGGDDGPQPFTLVGPLRFQAGGLAWHWNDFVQNCLVLGQIGSGKTSCVLNAILDGLIGSAAGELPCSGLILDPKGTFQDDARNLCLKYGRGRDFLVIDPANPDGVRWNPLDSADDEFELAARFAAVCRSLGTRDQQSSFWITKSTMFIQHALELVRLTNADDEPASFAHIYELASSYAAIAERADRLEPADPRGQGCLRFFATEWLNMGAELRGSVQAHLTGMIYPFLKEPYLTAFAGRSTISISDVLDTGKIVYLKMPTSDRETMARIIGIFLKLELYREVLKRPRKTRPSFFFCDEFQKYFTAGSKDDKEQERSDADTFRMSRESFHANVVATQNLAAFGEPGTARAFAANCLTSIFLRNTDDDTNQYASRLFSQEWMAVGGMMQGGGAGRLRPVGGQQLSTHDQIQDRVPAHRFRELAVCSPEQATPHGEAYVFLGGRGERPIPLRKLKWMRHPLST